MPSPLWGVKFEGGGANSTDYDWTVSFMTDRTPIWGDFYAVNGKKPGEETAIWNQGFTNPDTDPADPPGDTPIGSHILVPDTTTDTDYNWKFRISGWQRQGRKALAMVLRTEDPPSPSSEGSA